MQKAFIISFLLIVPLFGFISCSKSNSGGSVNTSVDCSLVANKAYITDVDPIIQSTCNAGGCHASGSTNGPGPITNYTQVFNARTVIRSAIASGAMPQNATLTAAQKNSIICWIDSGSPDN